MLLFLLLISAQEEIAITIGNHNITKSQIFDEMAHKYPKEVQEVAQQLAIYWIIRQECGIEKIIVPSQIIQQKAKQELQEFQQQIQQQTQLSWSLYLQRYGIQEKNLIQRLLLKWKYQLSMEQLVRLFESRQTRILVRHILTDTPAKAQIALQKLQQGYDFVDVVRQDSLSDTRNRGGQLPLLFRGDFEPHIDAVLFKMQPQQISPILHSSWGYHIFQLLEIQSGNTQASWQNLKNEIDLSLRQQPVTERDLQRWLQHVSHKYPIKRNFQFSIGEE